MKVKNPIKRQRGRLAERKEMVTKRAVSRENEQKRENNRERERERELERENKRERGDRDRAKTGNQTDRQRSIEKDKMVHYIDNTSTEK